MRRGGWASDLELMTTDHDKTDSKLAGGTSPRKIPWRSSAALQLIVLNVVVYLVQGRFQASDRFLELFPLSVEGVQHGYIWQLLTYQFLHGSWIHLLLNCWGIFLFGRPVEEGLGRKRFWILYLTSGVAGGVLQVAATLTWTGHFGGSVVGASAGLFGLIAAFATMFPHARLMLVIPPVMLRAEVLLLLSGALAVFGMLFPHLLAGLGMGSNVAHAAHLGGILSGLIFVRHLRHKLGYWPGDEMPSAKNTR